MMDREITMATLIELRASGVEKYGEVGAWAYDNWQVLNEVYFKGENIPGEIDWVADAGNSSLGYYAPMENRILLHKELVRPRYPTPMPKWSLNNLNQRMAADVLMHEMIHQRIHQSGGWEGESSHNNQRFVSEVNRIAALLGLEVTAKVIQAQQADGRMRRQVEPGCMTLVEIENFPYSKRPRMYYYSQG
jgi:hypothetical protein